MFRGYQKLTKILIINDFIVDSSCKHSSLAIIAVALGFVQQLMCTCKMQNRLGLKPLISIILCQHNSPSLIISNHFSQYYYRRRKIHFICSMKKCSPPMIATKLGRLREQTYIGVFYQLPSRGFYASLIIINVIFWSRVSLI